MERSSLGGGTRGPAGQIALEGPPVESGRRPTGAERRGIASSVPEAPDGLVVGREDVDLDRPSKFRDRQIEAGGAVSGNVDLVLADESTQSCLRECLADDDLRM